MVGGKIEDFQNQLFGFGGFFLVEQSGCLGRHPVQYLEAYRLRQRRLVEIAAPYPAQAAAAAA
jgi:hypothetical protein